MKSGSSSAVAFGRVLQAVRKRLGKNQADVAASLTPTVSVAAVSMAESGNRPPKTDVMVRAYAETLELDADGLLELWWAMQGMVEVEDWARERTYHKWWRDLDSSIEAEIDQKDAEKKAADLWTPNEDFYAPSVKLFTLAEMICDTLKRLLGDTWTISYRPEAGLREPVDGRLARVLIELRAGHTEQGVPKDSLELMTTFACPEPLTRPERSGTVTRPEAKTMQLDVAWILSSVEAMPARERAAVAGFIRGLREGASLFSETASPSRPAH